MILSIVRKLLGHHIATELSLPMRDNVTGFLTRCTFRVINAAFIFYRGQLSKGNSFALKGNDCSDMSNWKNFTTPVYGNCFTFNSNESSVGVRFCFVSPFKDWFYTSNFKAVWIDAP